MSTRADLNAAAEKLGIKDPDQLPNKEAVADAIAAAKAKKSQQRSFRLVKSSGENAPTRISFGASPRVSIGAGETYSTSDPRLAGRLAANPLLEEVTS